MDIDELPGHCPKPDLFPKKVMVSVWWRVLNAEPVMRLLGSDLKAINEKINKEKQELKLLLIFIRKESLNFNSKTDLDKKTN